MKKYWKKKIRPVVKPVFMSAPVKPLGARIVKAVDKFEFPPKMTYLQSNSRLFVSVTIGMIVWGLLSLKSSRVSRQISLKIDKHSRCRPNKRNEDYCCPGTMPVLLQQSVALFENNVALESSKRKITYKAFAHHVEKLSGALHRLGMQKGDRIGFLASPSTSWLEAAHSVWTNGMVVVAIPESFTPSKIARLIGDQKPQVMIVSLNFLPRLSAALKMQQGIVELVLVLGIERNPTDGSLRRIEPVKEKNDDEVVEVESNIGDQFPDVVEVRPFSDLEVSGLDIAKPGTQEGVPERPFPSDLASIFYNKEGYGMKFTHSAMAGGTSAAAAVFGVEESDVYLSYRSLSLVSELATLHSMLLNGAKIAFAEEKGQTVRHILRNTRRSKPTLITIDPNLLKKIVCNAIAYDKRGFFSNGILYWFRTWLIKRKVRELELGAPYRSHATPFTSTLLWLVKLLTGGQKYTLDKNGKEVICGAFGNSIRLCVVEDFPLRKAIRRHFCVRENCIVRASCALMEAGGMFSAEQDEVLEDLSSLDEQQNCHVGSPVMFGRIKIDTRGHSDEREVGEILFCGPGIFKEYTQNVSENVEERKNICFINFDGEKKWLRTGLQGRWRPDGGLEIV
eukprot:g4696.t1